MSVGVLRLLAGILTRSGLTGKEVHRRMARGGVNVGPHAVYSWLRGDRSPPLEHLAVLLQVIGATDQERLLLLDLAASSVRVAPQPVAA